MTWRWQDYPEYDIDPFPHLDPVEPERDWNLLRVIVLALFAAFLAGLLLLEVMT